MMQIYFPISPFQVLVASSLAKSNGNVSMNELYLSADFRNVGEYHDALTSRGSPFARIKLLANCRHENIFDKGLSYLNMRKNIHLLSKDKSLWRKNTFHLFNGYWIVGRYLARRNYSCGGTNIYHDEGMGTYVSLKAKRPLYERALLELSFSHSYLDSDIYRYSHKLQLLYPSLITPELKNKNVTGMPSTILRNLKNSNFTKTLFRNLFEVQAKKDISCLRGLGRKKTCLVTLPHSELSKINANQNWRGVYKKCVMELGKLYDCIIIKYHPRETKGDFLGLETQDNVISIPSNLPSELVLLTKYINPNLIIGADSTTLLTSKLIDDKLAVMDMGPFLGRSANHPRALKQLLRNLNVLKPKDLKEFRLLAGK